MEIRINLSQADFRSLVQGQVVEHLEKPQALHGEKIVVRVALSDIGFQAMTAEINTARRLKDEEDRRRALTDGRCRFCGKGGLRDHCGAARCTACGRLQ